MEALADTSGFYSPKEIKELIDEIGRTILSENNYNLRAAYIDLFLAQLFLLRTNRYNLDLGPEDEPFYDDDSLLKTAEISFVRYCNESPRVDTDALVYRADMFFTLMEECELFDLAECLRQLAFFMIAIVDTEDADLVQRYFDRLGALGLTKDELEQFARAKQRAGRLLKGLPGQTFE